MSRLLHAGISGVNRIVKWGSLPGESQDIAQKKFVGVVVCIVSGFTTASFAVIAAVAQFIFVPNTSYAIIVCISTTIACTAILGIFFRLKSERFLTSASIIMVIMAATLNQGSAGCATPVYSWLFIAPCIAILNDVPPFVTFILVVIANVVGTLVALFDVLEVTPKSYYLVAREPVWFLTLLHVTCTFVSASIILLLLEYQHSEILRQKRNADEKRRIITEFQEVLNRLYPKSVQDKLVGQAEDICFKINALSCSFIDLHNFTAFTKKAGVERTLRFIGFAYSKMDVISQYYGVVKVKTIGDNYMSIAGMDEIALHPDTQGSTAAAQVLYLTCVMQFFSDVCDFEDETDRRLIFAVNKTFRGVHESMSSKREKEKYAVERRYSDVHSESESCNSSGIGPTTTAHSENSYQIQFRAGIATGPCDVVVLQGKVPQLDAWGDVINTASRLESGSIPGLIQIDRETMRQLPQSVSTRFDLSNRRMVNAKGLGKVPAHFVQSTTYMIPEDLQKQLMISVTADEFHFDPDSDGKPTEIGDQVSELGFGSATNVPGELNREEV